MEAAEANCLFREEIAQQEALRAFNHMVNTLRRREASDLGVTPDLLTGADPPAGAAGGRPTHRPCESLGGAHAWAPLPGDKQGVNRQLGTPPGIRHPSPKTRVRDRK